MVRSRPPVYCDDIHDGLRPVRGIFAGVLAAVILDGILAAGVIALIRIL